MDMVRGIIVPNSSGLVTVTAVATGDLVHTLSTGSSAIIRRIFWSNNTGAVVTLIFGTQTNAAIPVFAARYPTISCANGVHDFLTQDQIPEVIFRVDRTATPGGFSGNIYVLSSAAGVIVRIAVEEIRA
jgi:hypothetical protein